MRDEGVTKYECLFRKTQAPAWALIDELNAVRNRLFAEGLIGVYPDGIGFGNASMRISDSRRFLITGTQTGHKPVLTADDYSLVMDYDIAKNRVVCEGLIAASSESLTHAAVYELDSKIQAVIHVHHRPLWSAGQSLFPTTLPSVAYGTPAMAEEMSRLYRDSELAQKKILIMAGHDEGVITFGATLAEAYQILNAARRIIVAKTSTAL